MNCGNVHDPVIEQHRLAGKHKTLAFQNGEDEAGENELIPESQPVILRAA